MDSRELIRFCLEKGFLLDKDVLLLLSEATDVESAKLIVERIKNQTGSKIITKNVFYSDKENVDRFFSELPEENQKKLEKLKIKLGLSIEISKEVTKKSFDSEPVKKIIEIKPSERFNQIIEEESVKVLSPPVPKSKKLEVKDFVKYFRSRYLKMQKILQEHSELDNLVSINKISGNSQGISIIGIVSSKQITKNKNILLEVEDLTGKIKILISKDKKELYEAAEDIALDSVLGFKGAGNRDIFFTNSLIFPDACLFERKKSPKEEYALFLGDIHLGSKLFFKDNFLKFIDYLNGKFPNTPEVEKIKYLFIVGDLIIGVGKYPGQEKDLFYGDLETQYEKATELLSKIRKDIKIILCPGNHDGVRIMEPQPIVSERYAWPLHNLKNVILTTNPSITNIASSKENGFPGFNVLMYHGFSYHYYGFNVSSLIKQKAVHKPELIMAYLLKNRHLFPTHASTQYFPSEYDPGLIEEVPDILFSGHTHKSAVSYYNNVLIVSCSSWEKLTPYQEKMGNGPDYCKVPMLNLKTRAIKILDFE